MNAQCTLFIQVVSTPKLNQLTAGMAAGRYTQKWTPSKNCRILQFAMTDTIQDQRWTKIRKGVERVCLAQHPAV